MSSRLALLVPLVLSAAAFPVLLGSSAVAAETTCQGRPATIASDASVVTGTEGDDVIAASTTTTRVLGLGGDDVICAYDATAIDAGAGDDRVVVTGRTVGFVDVLARPLVDLGPGNDTYTGWTGADLVDAGPTSDRSGADTISTGDGTDVVGSGAAGEPDVDVVDLGEGADVLELAAPDGSAMTADLGGGTDRVALEDQGAGQWTIDLRGTTGTVVHDRPGDLARLRGAEDVSVHLPNAARLDLRGNGARNRVTLSPTPVRLRIDLRADRDTLTLDDLQQRTRGRITLGGQARDTASVSSTARLAVALGERRVPGRLTLAGTRSLFATAPQLDVLGSPAGDQISETSCRVVVDARAGDDQVRAGLPDRYSPFACSGSTPATGQVGTDVGARGARLSGGTGADLLVGTAAPDVLLGGAGRDLARGRSSDRDVCRAEVERSCER